MKKYLLQVAIAGTCFLVSCVQENSKKNDDSKLEEVRTAPKPQMNKVIMKELPKAIGVVDSNKVKHGVTGGHPG